MLTGVQIDHELRQGAMQAGDRPTHQGEAGAGQLGGGLEIQPTVLLAQGDMILHREVEGLRRAPAANLDVLFLVRTDRHGLVRQVGDAQHQLVQLTLDAVQLLLAGFEFAAHAIHIGEQGAMSSPRCLAWPMDLERALRSAWSCSVRVCTVLRWASSASMRATSSW